MAPAVAPKGTSGGGGLVETPWFWLNNSPPSPLQVFSNGGGVVYSQSYPGMNVPVPADPLLNGVAIPGAAGGFNIGRTTGNIFAAGVTQIANWSDGTAFIGKTNLGAGDIIGINMHVITSDTAFQVIDQAWATQLFVNAVMPMTVPEPATLAIVGIGLAGLGLMRRRKRAA